MSKTGWRNWWKGVSYDAYSDPEFELAINGHVVERLDAEGAARSMAGGAALLYSRPAVVDAVRRIADGSGECVEVTQLGGILPAPGAPDYRHADRELVQAVRTREEARNYITAMHLHAGLGAPED